MSNSEGGLSSIDQYGNRVEIVPAEVTGFFRRWRSRSQWVLLIIFLVTPWIKINGNPLLLIDIVHSKYSILGVQFYAHDGPLIFFVVLFAALAIALSTLLFGRVWCGWACPQTVFIDAIYRRIEIFVEGDYIKRRQLKRAPFSFSKLKKWIFKWTLFTVASSIISHSFLAYFLGSENLLKMIQGGPLEHWNYFLLTVFATALLLFNFGWFREQFCIVMCPYGRFQSVLLDSNSMTVLYDEKRGEPRKAMNVPMQMRGDCVSCRRCVEVCPTGIDIRKGVQLECIGCTACIDACDEIMVKVNKPKGLIRYASLHRQTRFLRPRAIILSVLVVIACSGIVYSFYSREPFVVSLLRARDIPFQILNDSGEQKVMNHFKLHLHNQLDKVETFKVSLPEHFRNLNLVLTLPDQAISLQPYEDRAIHFFVLAPLRSFQASNQLALSLNIENTEQASVERPMILVGPDAGGSQ